MTLPRNSESARFLLVVDDSEPSQRAIQYCAGVLSSCGSLKLYLACILPALPAALLEFGGSEDPEKEEQLQTGLHQDQERWLAAAREKAQRLVAETQRSLANGIPAAEFEVEYIEPETGRETGEEVIELAKQRGCSTIVAGHKSHSWFRELVGHDLVEDLLRGGEGLAICVVE